MAKGQIVLANTKSGIVPALIRFFTKSNFSHSLVTLPDLLKFPMCIEAAASGVDALRFDSNYLNNAAVDIEVWEINITDGAKDVGIVAAVNDLETTYGFLEIPWFMWRWLCGVFGKDIKNQNNWCTNGIICSQLCRIYLTAAGLGDMFAGYGNGAMAPQDLRNVMLANPQYFKKVFSNT